MDPFNLISRSGSRGPAPGGLLFFGSIAPISDQAGFLLGRHRGQSLEPSQSGQAGWAGMAFAAAMSGGIVAAAV
jgi:hypothetical protein